jgi:hypothetical protein
MAHKSIAAKKHTRSNAGLSGEEQTFVDMY